MSLLESREVTMTYSNILGEAVKKTTTTITLPEPEHMVLLEMEDRSMLFTMRELFDALKGLMDGGERE